MAMSLPSPLLPPVIRAIFLFVIVLCFGFTDFPDTKVLFHGQLSVSKSDIVVTETGFYGLLLICFHWTKL